MFRPLQCTMKHMKILKMKSNIQLESYELGETVLKEDFLGKAIAECLVSGDHEGIVEVISIYLDILNKTKLLKKANMHRSTLSPVRPEWRT